MRVCQFRHFGTVLHVSNPRVGHGSREYPVFQTLGLLSIARRLSYTDTTLRTLFLEASSPDYDRNNTGNATV
jgi:hypothetical protein